MRVSKRQQGMTLLEVLVALVVVALALSAAIRSVNVGVGNIDYLKQQSIAHWVAMNHVNEVQLQLRLAKTHEQYEIEMAGQTWQLQSQTTATANSHIVRIEVSVKKDRRAESSLAKVIAYVGRP